MSSRKRKNSAALEKEGTLSKRARLLSDLWHSQEEAAGSAETSSSNPSSPVYRIKAIIGERPSEYLIDWADDSITGEKFRPDWQPKGNVNTAAIKAWEKKRPAPVQNNSSRIKRHRRRRRHPRSHSSRTSEATSAETQEPQAQPVVDSFSHQTNINHSVVESRVFESGHTQSLPIDAAKLPNVVVQVSQHSSFDRDLYITYQSSVSTQGNSSSVAQHPDSGLGDSSPEPETSATPAIEKDGIVPDSQSIPGSSSYVPTSSTFPQSTGVDQSSLISPPQHISRAPDLELSYSSAVGIGDSIEDATEQSLVLEIAESPLSVRTSQRSRSEPPPDLIQPSIPIPLRAEPPSLPRSASDPAAYFRINQQQIHRDKPIFEKDQSNHGQPLENPLFSGSQFLGHVDFSEQRQRLSEVQVPGSTDSLPKQGLEGGASNSELSLVFQTQVPLAFASQGTRVSLTLAEESWQARQSIPELDKVTIHFSSGSPGQGSRGLRSQRSASEEIGVTTVPRARRRTTTNQEFVISEDAVDDSHPSQATTTDDSVLSLRDPNSQLTRQSHSQRTEEGFLHLDELQTHTPGATSSSDLETRVLPKIADSREPPQPPSTLQDEMSETSTDKASLSGGSQPIGIREKLKKIREDGAAKREALEASRRVKGQPLKTQSTPTSPSVSINEQKLPQPSGARVPQFQMVQERQQSQPIVTRGTPILPRADRRLSQMSIPGAFSPTGQGELRIQVQPSRTTQSPRSVRPASSIPDKLPPQIQREPSRIEVQPLATPKELPLPVRHSQSVPHTPTTPSKLSMHKEASPARTITLQPMWLREMEFIIPLSMQPRILSQYMDTIEYYKRTIKKNQTDHTLSRADLDKLNELLGRLANVSTHIGLEGGGPSSQEEIQPEQEALYAELSSEKFNFLGHLLTISKDFDVHIALVSKPGHLLNIIETFLRGKRVRYNRPDTRTTSDPKVAYGRMEVSLISSGELGAAVMPRAAEIVIALDETFKAAEPQVIALRRNMINIGQPTPVIRLVVYSSVEHLDLCFQPTLDPIDRIRKLIFYVWNTQRIIGQLEPHEPNAKSFAEKVAAILQVGDLRAYWNLPRIAPIENLPVMDSDSSLSDMNEMEIEELKPPGPPRYWPNPMTGRVVEPGNPVPPPPVGKRPFDLEYGDTMDIQAKKQKMAARAHRGLPLEEPSTLDLLQRQLVLATERAKIWDIEKARLEKTIKEHQYWAECRQHTFEELRDKASNLHHDKLDLSTELEKTKTQLEKAREDIQTLKEERTELKQEIEDVRAQLVEHPTAAVAAAERERAKVRALEAEVKKLEKKNENLRNESDTVRRVYQDASAKAGELAAEVQTLECELAPLRRRVEELEKRRKEERKKDPKAGLVEEIKGLKVAVKNTEKLVWKKEEEIKELKRGRGGVQTRGSSVAPRSPRGGNSRGVSPAAGMLGGEEKKAPSGLRGRFNLDG